MRAISERPFAICLAFLVLLTWAAAANATPPRTPISVELALSQVPGLNEWATLTVTVTSVLNAPGTTVELILPQGVAAPTTTWTVDLAANTPVTVSSPVFNTMIGNLTLSARALRPVASGAVWGDMKSISLTIGSPVSGPNEYGWSVSEVPVAAQALPGDATIFSSDPTAFSFALALAEVPSLVPSVTPRRNSAGISVPAAPGNVTLRGIWHYDDRSNAERFVDQQLIEIRRGDGSALSPAVYCYTEIDGSFSCTFPHPGTTMRVWLRSWTSFDVPGGTDRLGIFSGPEVTGGCASDSINCSYSVQTAEISCASGATCDVGTWVVSPGSTPEPWMGAQWMTQDLIRSWKKLFFDVKHGPGVSAGPARITYPVPAGHVPQVPAADGWIGIEPPNQQSADIVLHEYGHVVMANLWQAFSPSWPASDCPSSHLISTVSGPGCAFSEGFADFWAWYSNELYDGDDSAANNGPIFNWPSGASTNMETRDGGTYQSGDQVEGNIAAALGDLFDSLNEGPATGAADRLSDGIQHIWHTISSQSAHNLSEWWSTYWSTLGHSPCPALDVLNLNSIQFALAQCSADLVVTSVKLFQAEAMPGGFITVNDVTANVGASDAGPSTTRYYLVGPTMGQMVGSRAVPRLKAGASTSDIRSVLIPFTTASGTYSVKACADDLGGVTESNELNNCLTSVDVLVIGRPDLVVTNLTNPPARAAPGTSFSETDTVQNQGDSPAAAWTSLYYLSLSAVKDSAARLLTGSRTVPSLAAGAFSTGTLTLTIPAGTPLGTYFLQACADAHGAVHAPIESHCRASATTILVGRPDLIVTKVANPPANSAARDSFSVTDTVKNQGDAPASASTTYYYLSRDTVKDGNDWLLIGERVVPGLAVRAGSTGTVTVRLPSFMPRDRYFLIACADALGVVKEQRKDQQEVQNNCRSSTTTVLVGLPDLVVTRLSNPPTVAAVGSSFSVTDTIANQGDGTATPIEDIGPAISTTYYLSLDAVKDSTDRLLIGIPPKLHRLAAGATWTETVSVTIPAGTPPATYFLIACADGVSSTVGFVIEQSEVNNCRASATTILVGPPDLVVATLSDPPATAAPGGSFSVTDTTKNQGDTPAGASTTRYYLSLNGVKNSRDRLLISGSRSVPSLAAGASSAGAVTVTIPASLPLATYFLLACSDDTNAVLEGDESNNCRAAATRVLVMRP
jgi:CARDB